MKFKCAHCQGVHHENVECYPIEALKKFCGHDEYMEKVRLKQLNRQVIDEMP